MFVARKYSPEFIWNKFVHAFIQHLLCDSYCLQAHHFVGRGHLPIRMLHAKLKKAEPPSLLAAVGSVFLPSCCSLGSIDPL